MSDGPVHGQLLVQAVAAKDGEALEALLAPDVDFRAMTPRRFWEGSSPGEVRAALAEWFEEDDVITGVVEVETGVLPGAERVGYRLAVTSAGRPHLVEQQAYLQVADGRISWLRIMCAGFRPVGPATAPDLAAGATGGHDG